MTREDARAEWAKAETFPDLCELMARFIEGTLPYCPAYFGDSVDDETLPLVGVLAMLNRRGFLTTMSQPGCIDDDLSGQRAFVEGFASEEIALEFMRRALYSSLHVDAVPPEDFSGPDGVRHQLPITLCDGHPFTWAPDSPCLNSPSQDFRGDLAPRAARALDAAWWVSVTDLEWGREAYLWKALLEEPRVGYSLEPHPDLRLGHDE
jgi:hypothetical protein